MTRTTAPQPTDAELKADAQAAVNRAAASFPHPPSARPIKPDQRLTEGFTVPEANAAQKTMYLSSTQTVQQTLAFFTSAFTNSSASSSISAFSRGSFHMSILRVTLPGRRTADSAAPTAQIAVAAVAGGVAIGVLITATWNQRRPADTYIGQSPGTVDVQREPASGEPTFNAQLSGPGANRLAAAVDALRIQADLPYSCPTGKLTTTTLTFHPNKQVTTVTLLSGCPYGPFLTAGGATYMLASDGTIETTLRSVLPSLPNR